MANSPLPSFGVRPELLRQEVSPAAVERANRLAERVLQLCSALYSDLEAEAELLRASRGATLAAWRTHVRRKALVERLCSHVAEAREQYAAGHPIRATSAAANSQEVAALLGVGPVACVVREVLRELLEHVRGHRG